VEVNGSGVYSSILRCAINCDRNKFYSTGPSLRLSLAIFTPGLKAKDKQPRLFGLFVK